MCQLSITSPAPTTLALAFWSAAPPSLASRRWAEAAAAVPPGGGADPHSDLALRRLYAVTDELAVARTEGAADVAMLLRAALRFARVEAGPEGLDLNWRLVERAEAELSRRLAV